MKAHMLEFFLWLLTAFFLGGVIGCLLRQLVSGGETAAKGEPETVSATPARQAAPSTAATQSAATDSTQQMQGLMGATPSAAETASKSPAQADEKKGEEKGASASSGAQKPATSTEEEEQAPASAAEAAAKTASPASTAATAAKSEKEAAAKSRKASKSKSTSKSKAAPSETVEEAPAAEKATTEKTATGKTATGKTAKDAEASSGESADSLPAFGMKAPLGGEPDDLQLISGIGPKLEKLLHEMGIYHYAQIAAWTKKDIEEVDAKLKFKGRIERDEWVRQAKLLAAGRMEEFERDYGTGGLKGKDGKTRPGARTRKKT